MKKIILTLVAGLLLTIGITACSDEKNTNNAAINDSDADVIVFSQTGCPHCTHAMEFIEGDLKKQIPDIVVKEYDIRKSKHAYELFIHNARKYIKDGTSVGTPFIIVGDNYMMGWSIQHRATLEPQLINYIKQKRADKQPKQ